MTIDAGVERAGAQDLDSVLGLLTRVGLPLDGVREHLTSMLVARRGPDVIGSAALEFYRHGALLRSVAVAPECQGEGVARTLIEAAIRLARERDAPAIYLLTTTAERFFPRFGFERIERSDVPPSVQASVEFTSACPTTATVMRRRLL